MENKNPIFSIKNFRSFGEEGSDFELAPITVLTGCNSAGKSSLVKGQLLLSKVAEQIHQRWGKQERQGIAYHAISLRELFSALTLHVSDKELQLGRFDRAVNAHSCNKTISYTYTFFSKFLLKNITAELSFSGNNDEVVNDAVLTRLCIKIGKETLLEMNDLDKAYKKGVFHLKENEHINYLCLLDSFKKYMVFSLGEKYLMKYSKYDILTSDKSENDLKTLKKDVLEWVRKIGVDWEIEQYRNIPGLANMAPSYEAIEDYLKSQSLYSWLPIFEYTENMSKAQVREWLLEKARAICVPENKKPEDWVNHFCDDFESSASKTITDFFMELETKYLSEGGIDINTSMVPKGYFGIRMYSTSQTFFDIDNPENNRTEHLEVPNRLSRKKYDESYSLFPAVIAAFEDLFFYDKPVDPVSLEYVIPHKGDVIRTLKAFAKVVIVDAIEADFLEDITYINSSSTTVRRLYVLDDNDKIGNAINQVVYGNKQQFICNGHSESTLINDEKFKYSPRTFLDKWCERFGLGKITIEGSEQGLGAMVYVEKNGQKRLMADEGYGITQLFTLLLQIECRILKATRREVQKGKWTNSNANYTIDYAPQCICIEEPENHLHPKFQSMLAEMFVEAYQKYNIHFIIETHSEYLIRKLQVMVADKENKLTSNEVSINYVDKDENGISHNRQIKILDDGSLGGKFGTGFFDEAASLAVTLFKSKNVLS